jgi:hypothetical protein
MSTQSLQGNERAPIAVVQKNQREELRFTLDEYKGHRFVSLQILAPGPDGKMVPTRSGVTFRPDLLAEVREALSATDEHLRSMAENGPKQA